VSPGAAVAVTAGSIFVIERAIYLVFFCADNVSEVIRHFIVYWMKKSSWEI
jgi:hypothetical protein